MTSWLSWTLIWHFGKITFEIWWKIAALRARHQIEFLYLMGVLKKVQGISPYAFLTRSSKSQNPLLGSSTTTFLFLFLRLLFLNIVYNIYYNIDFYKDWLVYTKGRIMHKCVLLSFRCLYTTQKFCLLWKLVNSLKLVFVY